MRGRLLIVVLFVLTGAVVNVGVAWGCAAWIDLTSVVPDSKSPQRQWRYHWKTFDYFNRVGASRMAWRVAPIALVSGPNGSVNPQDEFVRTLPQVPVPDLQLGEVLDRRGWPILSMQCAFVNTTGDVWKPRFEVRRGIALTPIPGRDERGLRALPLSPLWFPFTTNTLFYAVILWLLIRAPFAVRCFLRRKHGLCPACGYPGSDSPACTECGYNLRRSAGVV